MKILYVCTHNRCRSILSEAIANHLGKGKLQAYSAGSQPAGEVHPLSLKYLAEKSIPIEGLKSQSWDDFEAEQPDIVVTLCDSVANEVCPTWLGDTVKVHWGLPDPSKFEGTEEEMRGAFFTVMQIIEQRTQSLLGLDFEGLSKVERQAVINRLIKE